MRSNTMLTIAVFASNLLLVNASTYHLTFDSLISKKSSNTVGGSGGNAAEAATKLIASHIINSAASNSDSSQREDDIVISEHTQCFPIKISSESTGSNKQSIIGDKCMFEQRHPTYSLEITTLIQTVDRTRFNKDSQLAFSLDAKVQSTSTSFTEEENKLSARNSLVEVIPIIENEVITSPEKTAANDDEPDLKALDVVWQIFERHTPTANIKSHNGIEPEEEEEDDVQSSQACVENRILNNDEIKDKKQISVTSQNQVWEYTSLWTEQTHRDLFIDSYLRATTSPVGQAHAEAFIHPAMISHALPKRVALISDMPVAYVKEILKYEIVEDITLLGADVSSINTVKSFLPLVNDCSLIQNVSDECMNDSKVEIVNDDLSSWLDQMVDECEEIDFDTTCQYDDKTGEYSLCAPEPAYDIIFIDAASIKNLNEWLSPVTYAKYNEIITFDSVIVINIGSPPTSDGRQSVEALENLIEVMNESMTDWDALMVYDEPAADPLNSAFLFKMYYHSEAYFRFVRETPTAYDLDMVRRFHPQTLPPTNFYDGTTHLRYLKPSRSWENWYCESAVGVESMECTMLLKRWYDRTKHDHKTVVLSDPIKGRSLHAAEDIPAGSFINSDDTHAHLHIDAHQWHALNKFIDDFPEAKLYKDLRNFFITYGFENEPIGLSGWSVSVANNNTFTNHGCTDEERNVKSYPYSEDPATIELAESTFHFSLVMSRRPQLSMATGALRDIKKGEAIAMDYSVFRTFSEEDEKFTKFLHGICNTGVGLVDANDGSSIDSCIANSTCF